MKGGSPIGMAAEVEQMGGPAAVHDQQAGDDEDQREREKSSGTESFVNKARHTMTHATEHSMAMHVSSRANSSMIPMAKRMKPMISTNFLEEIDNRTKESG